MIHELFAVTPTVQILVYGNVHQLDGIGSGRQQDVDPDWMRAFFSDIAVTAVYVFFDKPYRWIRKKQQVHRGVSSRIFSFLMFTSVLPYDIDSGVL